MPKEFLILAAVVAALVLICSVVGNRVVDRITNRRRHNEFAKRDQQPSAPEKLADKFKQDGKQ